MATPAIQTLLTDAQQVLNLNSLSEVRSTMAAALANANVGTPLNPNLTTQQLWDEFYLIVRQPESDIESIITNQLMKFLFAPPAPGGAGANHEVIYNNNGVLAGDPKFLWDDALNKLDIDGSATISGDLTVDTNVLKVNTTTNRVGINTTTPTQNLQITGSGDPLTVDGCSAIKLANTVSGRAAIVGLDDSQNFVIWNVGTEVSETIKFLTGGGSGKEQYRITHGGVFNWYDGASGTRMTLNATGLGVGAGPSYRLHVQGTASLQLVLQSNDTNANAKEGTVNVRHYTNAEEPVSAVGGFTTSTANEVYLGGGFSAGNAATLLGFYTAANNTTTIGTERVRVKGTGQVRFVPLAADPSGAEAGDVYYNSVSNRLKYYNGTAWTLI